MGLAGSRTRGGSDRTRRMRMQRPIGVTLLAIGAGIAGLYQIWLALVYLGVFSFNIAGKSMTYPTAQWGAALWSLLIAAIWFLGAGGGCEGRAGRSPLADVSTPFSLF